MSSKDYWAKREEANRQANVKSDVEYAKEIQEIYKNMMDQIEKEINGFYTKYARDEGITMAEAKKRVSQLEIEKYERKAKRYVKNKDFSSKANEEMKLYNLTMKINRLELLKANIGLEMVASFDELDKFFDEKLTERTLEEFERQAGILGKTITNNAEMANSIVNASFKNATFSDRIWMYQGMMKAELDKLLQEGIIQGKHPNVLARHLTKLFGVSAKDAQRLMVTEMRRVQTGAQQASFEKNGFTEYTFIAEPTACPICAALNGKHFKVKDMLPGENAAPMHPRCRCSVAAYEDSEEYKAWLDFLSKGGTTEEWNKSKNRKNDIDFQDRIRRRREAYKNRQKKQKNVNNCKSVQDVVDLFKTHNDWFYKTTLSNGKHYNASDYINFDKFDLESSKHIYKSFDKFFDKYPNMKGKLNSVWSASLSRETYGECSYGFGHGGIALNSKHMSNYEKTVEQVSNSMMNGFHPTGLGGDKSVDSLVMHEIGHALDDYLSYTEHIAGYKGKGTKAKEFSTSLRPKVLKKCNMNKSDISKEVSGYASENAKEWFAECFSEYMLSDNPRIQASEFGKMLEEIMKGIE